MVSAERLGCSRFWEDTSVAQTGLLFRGYCPEVTVRCYLEHCGWRVTNSQVLMQDPGAWPCAEAVPRETVSHRELQGKNHPAHPPGPGWDTEDRGSSDTDHRVNLAGGGGWGWLGGQGRTLCTPSPHSPSPRLKGPKHLVTGILQNGFTASLHSQPVLFGCSVVSDSLRSHGLQHTRLPYPSPSHRVCSNSCPFTW